MMHLALKWEQDYTLYLVLATSDALPATVLARNRLGLAMKQQCGLSPGAPAESLALEQACSVFARA